MKREAADARRRFTDEITQSNLRNLWWLSLTTFSFTIIVFVYNEVLTHRSQMLPVVVADLSFSVLLIWLLWLARRNPSPARWKRGLVLAYVLLMLILMDAYFFSSISLVGHNSSYVVGVLTCAVLVTLSPPLFLSLIAINHAVYCALLLFSGRETDAIIAALTDGSAGVVISGLASYFLYTARWSNFRKERLIAQRNRQLAATNRELQERAEEMDELMAIAAHDLRSPLESQQNLLVLTRDRPAWKPGQLAEVIDTAVQSCRAMLSLVGRLLDAHQAEHLGPNLPLDRADLRPLLREAVDRAAPAAGMKNISIEAILPDEPASASIQAAPLAAALDNLIGNALKFSPPGSAVTVALLVVDGRSHIEVRDEGPGIPESERPLLFRKFHRGANLPTAGESTSGMGLFIVKKLMEAMRGSVEYTPRHPRGAVFHLHFGE